MTTPALTLDPSQELAVQLAQRERLCVITGGPGCHRLGQPILRADGTVVPVESIGVGDRLAGFDGAARTVLALNRGHGEMALVRPVKGEPWVVNMDHVLTVVHSCTDEVTDVTVREFLAWSAKRREKSKLFRQGFDFSHRTEAGIGPTQPITPYVLGVMLGDGCLTNGARVCVPDNEIVSALRCEANRFGLRLVQSKGDRCPSWTMSGDGRRNPVVSALQDIGLLGKTSGEKFVPHHYLTASRGDRLELLAGLLDTDGHLDEMCAFDFISKSRQLSEHVAFLARSLALAAYVKRCEKSCQTGARGTYWRVCISGDIDVVPTRVKRKKPRPREQIKDALRTGFVVDILAEPEDFYGFTLDGDGRYLLGDFTVTHNTGKTTTTRTILDRIGPDAEILLASPTGKAAKRLSECTGRSAMTVHRLLGYRPGAGFNYTGTNPLDGDVVVIDESSMLDMELAAALFEAVDPRRTRLILVGDADQLPSVGPGRVFADLVECGHVPVARLTHVHRSAQQSWIATNAPLVLAGKVPDLAKRADFRFVSVERGEQVCAEVVRQAKGFTTGAYPQVLVPQNTLAAGADALNKALQAAINPTQDRQAKQGEPRVGDRVIQTKNDYGLMVFNGEVGIVVAKEGRACTVDFGDRAPVKYDFEQAGALKLAYALSVHKSQGSEFPWAIVVCHSTHSHMLTRSLVYTAITRAKIGVVLVGDKKGVEIACSAKKQTVRNSGLVDRLAELRGASGDPPSVVDEESHDSAA